MDVTEHEKSHELKAVEMDRTISCNEGQLLAPTNLGTKRGIKSRHVQMMAIGGAIGTSLFVGAGQALSLASPATLLLAYITIYVLVYGILTATCEMNTYLGVMCP